MVVKSWNRLKRNGCMDAWRLRIMQSCNSPNTPSGIPGRLTSYYFFKDRSEEKKMPGF